jgi:hypothetical protein
MSRQLAVTVVTPIKPAAAERLKGLLAAAGEDPVHNDLIPFGRCEGVHFARFVVLDATVDLDGAAIPPQLIYMADVDAPLERHLTQLVTIAGSGLDQIYGHCEDYPDESGRTCSARLAYLRAHMVAAATVYVNTVGRTVRQIRQEAQLRDAIQAFLDRPGHDWIEKDPRVVRAAIQRYVFQEEALRWARRPAHGLSVPERLADLAHLVAVPLLLLVLSPLVVLALPVFAVALRLHERADIPSHARPGNARIQELAAHEDHTVQNPFSAVGYLKPGPFRRWVTTVVLWLTKYGTRHIYNRGSLTGVTTIHFARWIYLDDKRRMIFASSYDGSLESYMDDFIDKVAWGLNAVFSNGVGYPRTDWLVIGGTQNEQAFKDYLRQHQVLAQLWYAAYDRLTAVNLETNARIRAGLYGSMDVAEAAAWLRLL